MYANVLCNSSTHERALVATHSDTYHTTINVSFRTHAVPEWHAIGVTIDKVSHWRAYCDAALRQPNPPTECTPECGAVGLAAGFPAKPLANSAPNTSTFAVTVDNDIQPTHHRAYPGTLHFAHTSADATANRVPDEHGANSRPCDEPANPVSHPSSSLERSSHWHPDFD